MPIDALKNLKDAESGQDIVCLNGLIQVVTSILSVPTSIVLLTAQAQMSFFIAILTRANVGNLFAKLSDSFPLSFLSSQEHPSSLQQYRPFEYPSRILVAQES